MVSKLGTAMVACSPGVGFMPHILDVKSGENVLAKLEWFSHNSTRTLCILSASGAISNRQQHRVEPSFSRRQQHPTEPSPMKFVLPFKGRFEILSLSVSFMVSEGGLSVALSRPDGRVLGGNVAGHSNCCFTSTGTIGFYGLPCTTNAPTCKNQSVMLSRNGLSTQKNMYP